MDSDEEKDVNASVDEVSDGEVEILDCDDAGEDEVEEPDEEEEEDAEVDCDDDDDEEEEDKGYNTDDVLSGSDTVDDLDYLEPTAPILTDDPSGSEACCFYLVSDNNPLENVSIGNIAAFASKENAPKDLECRINEISQLCNSCCYKSSELQLHEKASLLDIFLRYRHELLSSLVLKVLKLENKHTDMAFCEVFPISSKRTPDFIIKNKEKSYLIIEISAVSDVEKGARNKGDPRKGYESKYEKELQEIRTLGFSVSYTVIIFDMKNEHSRDHNEYINEASMLLNVEPDLSHLYEMEYIRKELCNATKLINEHLGRCYKYLFSEPYILFKKSNFESLYIYGEPESKYDGNYTRFPISSFVYDLSSKLMVRLPRLIDSAGDNAKMTDRKLLIGYDLNQDRFSFYISTEGGFLDDWLDAVEKGWKMWVCKNMRVFDTNHEVVQKADFEYFEIVKGAPKINIKKKEFTFSKHANSKRFLNEGIYKDFRNIVSSQEYAKMTSKYEDNDYEESLLSGMKEFNSRFPINENINLKPEPFCNNRVGLAMFENAKQGFVEKMNHENRYIAINGKLHVKQPFIYPVYCPTHDHYMKLNEKPKELLNFLIHQNIGPYMRKTLSLCCLPSFEFGTHKLVSNNVLDDVRKELGEYSRSVNYKLKEMNRSNMTKKNSKVSDLPDYEEIKKNLSNLNQRVREESRKAGVTNKKIGLITFNNKKTAKLLFKEEMKHFKSKSTPMFYKGVGDNHDLEEINQAVETFFEVLLGPSVALSNWDILDVNVYRDAQLLFELKQKAMNEYKGYYEYLKNTNLFAVCEFISKFCHSLLFHSQTSSNSSTIAVDNLGYKNVILLVKGGKKIFGTKKTKLFRLVYPSYESMQPICQQPGYETSFKFFEFEGSNLTVTPWMNMNETVITDGLTLSHRLMGFALINCNHDLDFPTNLRRVYFNIILSLHNRRQTEMLLHNLRYVFMNCMSYFSSVDQILPELAGFNYDFIQVWLRGKIKTNFVDFATKMKSLHDETKKGNVRQLLKKKMIKHPFTNEPIEDLETLALSVYSTYLMSKSPTSQSLEQVSNLKSMLETHDEFKANFEKTEEASVTFQGDYGEYYQELFRTDFNYDPKYCVLLGKFFGDYLSQLSEEKSIHLKWEQILDESWNNLANTKGLRYKGKDFFGSKGYYVVNKEILDNQNGYEDVKKLLDIIDSESTIHEKEKTYRCMNQTYRSRIKEQPFECAVFHVVDKKQRGGKREIFVMDLETKVHQQVIEKYMAYLCKITPNEMISIPSNRRLQTIHSRVFESGVDSEDQCFLVLDCRKWAPKSLVEKFLLFLSGMSHVLPSSFICHCQNFFYLLMKKKIYTRKYIQEQFSKNENLKKHLPKLTLDEEKEGYYYAPEYSWVMGIFNYFSSIFHVACQMHISHMLRIDFNRTYGVECNLHMVAHSDDSAGKINCGDVKLVGRALFYYETYMHAANHLISRKKSNVGKLYYEFISILYIGGELLSLLAKFSGVFNFHPSDKGYCFDITEAYSKCIELVLNGSSLNQAYLAEKIQADLIYRFYFNKPPDSDSYLLPPSMFGSIDSHPLLVMLCGSEADTVRLLHTLGEEGISTLIHINESLLPLSTTGDGMFKQFTSKPKVKLNKNLQKMLENNPLPSSFLESWSMKNIQYKHTIADLAQFLSKLRDGTFVAALQDETLVRRLSRSYYYRSGLSIDTNYGPMTISQVKEVIYLLRCAISGQVDDFPETYKEVLQGVKRSLDLENKERAGIMKATFELVHNEAICLMNHLDRFTIKNHNILNIKKTCKPVHFKMQATIDECPIEFEPSTLVSWVKEPQYRFMLPNTRGLLTTMNYLDRICSGFGLEIKDLSPENLFMISRKLNKRSKIEFFCYSNLPSGIREITTYQDIMLFLAHNSNPNEYIKGLDVQYGRNISSRPFNVLPDYEDCDLQWTMSFYLVLLTCLKATPNKVHEISSLEVNTPEFLDAGNNDNMISLFAKSRSYWHKRQNYEKYLTPYMHQIERLIENDDYLDPDIISDTYHHVFLKRQFLLDNLWLGRGRLFISCGLFKCVFNLHNNRIISVTSRDSDYTFTMQEITYMNYCLSNSQLPKINSSMRNIGVDDWDKIMLGVNLEGLFYIGKARDMITAMDLDFDYNLRTTFSQMNLGVLKFDRKGKMLWRKSENGKELKYALNFIPLSPQNAMDLTKGLIKNNRNNGILLSGLNTDPSNFIIDMCVEDFDIEVSINFNNLIYSPNSSMIYKVLKKCDMLQLCKVRVSDPNYTHYPAQDGGLLRALIEYAKVTDQFSFNWDHYISEEYYNLKSSQPEAFTTELFDNLSENYKKLFRGEDKEQITKALSGLIDSKSENEGSILKMACEWGYVGVQGALDDLISERKRENFKGIRVYQNGVLRSYYSKVFMEMQTALYRTLIVLVKNNPAGFDTIGVDWTRVDMKNYKNQFISHIHQIMISIYQLKPSRKSICNLSNLFAYTIIVMALNEDEAQNEFKFQVSKIANFRTLPCKPENQTDWIILYNTLKANFIGENTREIEVNYGMTVDRDAEYERPYTLTKDFCSRLGLNFQLKRTYYSGVLSSALYNRFNGNFKVKNKGGPLSVKLRFDKHNNSRAVHFSNNIFPRHKFAADFLDSDEFEDISVELISFEFDEEAYNECIENYEEKVYDFEPIKKVKIVSNGRLIDTANVEIKVLALFGGSYNDHNLSKLRQTSEDVIMLTDHLDFFMPMIINPPLIFRNVDMNWFNLSLLNPQGIFIYVFTTRFRDSDFWETILCAKQVKKEEYSNLLNLEVGKYLGVGGAKLDSNELNTQTSSTLFYDGLKGQMEEKEEAEKLKKQEEEEERRASSENEGPGGSVNTDGFQKRKRELKIKTLEERLRSSGMEESQINKYIDLFKKEISEKGEDEMDETLTDIISYFKLYFNNKQDEQVNKLKGIFSKILKKELTKEQRELIFQVPLIFGGGRSKRSGGTNRSLKNPYFISEMESLAPGLIWDLLSGNLGMSSMSRKRWENHLTMLNMMSKGLKCCKKGKLFVLNLVKMILNDAKPSNKNDNDDERWSNLMHKLTEVFVEGEDSSSDDEDMYSEPEGVSRFQYEVAGMYTN